MNENNAIKLDFGNNDSKKSKIKAIEIVQSIQKSQNLVIC